MRIKKTLMLTPQLRRELKTPLGTLLEGSPKQTMERTRQLVKEQKPTKTITVGDTVSQNLTRYHIPVDVMIVDNRVLREPIQPIEAEAEVTVHVRNPPSTITPEAWTTIKHALEQNQRTKVIVDGEEDLLAIVAVMQAPADSLVIYGQPHEGVVVIKVTAQTKEMMQNILNTMQPQ